MEDDIVIASMTQTAEQLKDILEDDGFEDVKTDQNKVAEDPEEPKKDAPKEDKPVPEKAPEESPAGKDEDETEPEPEPEPTPIPEPTEHKKKGGYQRKWEKEKAAREELERKVAELTARVDAPKEPVKVETPPVKAEPAKVEPAKVEVKPKPKLDEYESYEDYVDALTDWKYDERKRNDAAAAENERKEKEALEAATHLAEEKANAEKSQKEVSDRWSKELTQVRSAHADMAELENKHGAIVVSLPLQLATIDSEHAGEVYYYLLAHPEEINRITKATMVDPADSPAVQRRKMSAAYREIEKIEALVATAGPSDEEEGGDSEDVVDDVLDEAEAGSREAPVTPAKAAPAKVAKPPEPEKKAVPVTPAPPPKVKPKPIPMTPVGNRGGAQKQSLSDLPMEKQREADIDDWRKEFGL